METLEIKNPGTIIPLEAPTATFHKSGVAVRLVERDLDGNLVQTTLAADLEKVCYYVLVH